MFDAYFHEATVIALAKGTTILLALGALIVCLAKSEAVKQRTAELTVFVTVAWLLLAFVPLPRLTTGIKVSGQAWSQDFSNLQTLDLRVNGSTPLLPEVASSDRPVDSAGVAIAIDAKKSDSTSALSQNTAGEERELPDHFSWQQLLLQLALAVSVCFGVWILLTRLAVSFMCLRSKPAPIWIGEMYKGIEKRRDARVLICPRNVRPMSFGVFRPTIVLPKNLDDRAKTRIVRHVLLHEQAHVDRRDAIGNSVLVFALPLLWFHPLYWFLRYIIDESREMIADDVAAGQSEKHAYMNDLIELLRESSSGAKVSGAIGVFGLRHPFSRRMSALLERGESLQSKMRFSKSLSLCLMFTCLLISATAVLGTQTSLGQTNSDVGDSDQVADTAQDDSHPNSANESNVTSQPVLDPAEHSNESNVVKHRFRAIVSPISDVELFAPEQGSVAEVLVKPGQTVKKGDVLVNVKSAELERELVEAQQGIEMLTETIASDINTRDAELGARSANAALQQLSELHQKHAASSLEVARSEGEVSRWELRVKQAEVEKRKLQLQLRHKRTLLTRLQERLAQLQVRSHADGIVESVNTHAGKSIQRGDVLLRVVSLDRVRIEFDVDESKVFPPQLLGEKVVFELNPGYRKQVQLSGKIAFVSTEVDLNNRAHAWADCENIRNGNHWVVRPGMTGTIAIRAKQQSDANDIESNEAGPRAQLKSQEIEYLEELAETQTTLAKFASTSFEHGIGTKQQVDAAQRDLWRTKAELALAKEDHDSVVKAYEKAIEFAVSAERSYRKEMEAGRANLLAVSLASREVTKLKLEYLRYRKSKRD